MAENFDTQSVKCASANYNGYPSVLQSAQIQGNIGKACGQNVATLSSVHAKPCPMRSPSNHLTFDNMPENRIPPPPLRFTAVSHPFRRWVSRDCPVLHDSRDSSGGGGGDQSSVVRVSVCANCSDTVKIESGEEPGRVAFQIRFFWVRTPNCFLIQA